MLSTAAVAAALCSVAVAASTGSAVVHDPEGFGPHGRLATIGGLAWPARQERAAVTGDSRIYVAAAPGPRGAPEAVRVRRYLPDGKPDRSFGIAGSVIPGELGGGFRLDELLVDTNGLPYLVGTTGDGELVVARLALDGEPDPTFGNGGIALLGPLPADATGPRATIDQQNRVIVAAGAVVERLTPSGAPDPTFGADGAVPLPSADIEGLGVDEEGHVQLTLPGTDGEGFRLMRLGLNGEPTIRAFTGIGEVRAMAVRFNGTTLVAGTATKRTGEGVAVPLLRIPPRAVHGRADRSSVQLRGRDRVAEVLADPNGDDYLIGEREIVDLDIHPEARFAPGETWDHFGRNGRAKIGSSGNLTVLGATITDSGGTLLVDGVARPRGGGVAHAFLAKFPAAEHVITYAPEPMGR